jgi:hypothetical protein
MNIKMGILNKTILIALVWLGLHFVVLLVFKRV